MRRTVRLMLAICLLMLWAIPAQAERRIALVIGNGAYTTGPLNNPANDARDMAATLKILGFEVSLVTDATLQQMETAVREFGSKLRQGGVGLFFYAGHGVQVAGENFLIPVNAVIQSEGDVKYGSLNAGLILAKMEDAGNGLNIVILDACRSNPFARSFRSAELGLAKMDAPTGSLIAYATAPGSVASDGRGRNGVFTKYLLETMKTPGLPISEVLMRVRQGVVQETAKKQVPWEASSLIGQFYFSKNAEVASLAPVTLVQPPTYGPPAPIVSTAPQSTDVDLGMIEQKAGERAKAEIASKKQWAEWLAGMKDAIDKAQALEKKPGVSASDKAEAWLLLAPKYTQKDPYSDEDDALRLRMAKRADYWTAQAESEAQAREKSAEARLAAEQKLKEEAKAKPKPSTLPNGDDFGSVIFSGISTMLQYGLAQAKTEIDASSQAKKQEQSSRSVSATPMSNQVGEHEKLGIVFRSVKDDKEALALNLTKQQGLLVLEIVSGSSASKVDIQPGDVIMEADKHPVDNADQIIAVIDGDARIKGIVMLLIKRQRRILLRPVII